MYVTLKYVAACSLLALAPTHAAAWNAIGHMAVVKLAYDQMDDALKLKLFKILKQHPHYTKFLAANRPSGVSEMEWVFLRASIWPDWIRPRRPEIRGPEVTRYHRGPEHYINIPIFKPDDAQTLAGRTLVDPDATNILSALKQRCNDLSTSSAAEADRAISICWIFHLIGDIHQPLHNVAFFDNTEKFRSGDLGGNKFGVRIQGQKYKLHTYWDDLLGIDPNYADDSPEHDSKIYQQSVAVAEQLRGEPLSGEEKEKLRTHLTFESWSQEGYELARKAAYQKDDGGGFILGAVVINDFVPDDAPELGKVYAENARKIAGQRVALAGHRLAQRLAFLIR
jgi:hypothetical protein